MKLVQIIFHFEFADRIERILDRRGIETFIRIPMVESKDRDGKHYGNKVFPGHSSLIEAQLEDGEVADLLEELQSFREEREAHRHLRALVYRVEEYL
ncbi:MAG: PG0541 family transporter-associated protein [Desulfovibrionales bacterium]